MSRFGPGEVSVEKFDPSCSIKIGADLLCDNSGSYFESVKANVRVKQGKWYYEVKLVSNGKLHFGWCTEQCVMPAHSYNGIGSNKESWAYDGSAQRVYHNTTSSNDKYGEYWNINDTIGVLLDCDSKTISYFKNGKNLGVAFKNVSIGTGLYPCASIQRRQKCQFNFGKTPFKYGLSDAHGLHINLTKEQAIQLEKLFEKYKAIGVNLSESGETDDVIKGQGTLEFGQHIGIVEDTDPGLMIVSWKLNVNHEKSWEFLRSEWMEGWAIHGCHDIESMKQKVKAWQKEVEKPEVFRQFYFYVFDYLREDKTSIPIEEATTVWSMLSMNKRWAMMSDWEEFLVKKKQTAISRDQWRRLLNFTMEHPKDLSNYDEDACWPTLIDDFVEYELEKNKK